MFGMKDIAESLNIKSSTLRYWIDKNKIDFEKGIYDFNLSDLIKTVMIFRRTASKNNVHRHYRQLIILDLEEFKNEFFKYIEFKKALRKNKKIFNTIWTPSALDCYNCKMNCSICFNKKICKNIIAATNQEPPMKKLVKNLLLKFGKPPINLII